MEMSKECTGESAAPRRCLVVGNYCHDRLFRGGGDVVETLGGAPSFIAVVHAGLSIQSDYVSKVGSDFAYFDSLSYKPIVSSSAPTTLFHALFANSTSDSDDHRNGNGDRVLKRIKACEAIRASDLPDAARFEFGLAVGVAGEILPETPEKMLDICDVVFADIQALIRSFDDDSDGTARLIELKESGFYHLIPRLGFLKASSEEALQMDIEQVKNMCSVVVTDGKEGSTLLLFKEQLKMKIRPFQASVQVDPTGAGDSFVGGLSAGLAHGLSVADAALIGNLFGSIAVQYTGLPHIEPNLLQRINEEIEKRKLAEESKLAGHEQFHLALCAAFSPDA